MLGRGQTVDEPFAQSSSTGTAYYHVDALSSVTSLTNSSTAISSTDTYDSFGNSLGSTDTNANTFRYTGRELDPETGLNFYRARYFDSSIGRFTSEDPLRFAAGIDFYRYVSNDPTNLTDPYGLAELCCRIARSVYWLGIKGCHCFLKLSDGTTFGEYWKWSSYLLLEKRVNENDDRNPKDPPSCKDVPGSEGAMRRVFNQLPRFQPYGLGGTSNSIPAAILTLIGSPFAMPSCAFGAFPFNLRELGNPAPVPINSVPTVKF